MEVDENSNDSDEDMEETRTQRNKQSKSNNSYVFTRPILSKFGKHVMNYFRISPRPTFLLGSLDKEILMTQKKVRQRKAVDKSSNEELRTKIKELDVNSKENETSTTVTEIERIFKILKRYFKRTKGTPICLYEFMINPTSFSRTIENIFYVSFLVKDGFAKIYLDTDNLPVIEPILENEPESFDSNDLAKRKKANTVNIQSMVSLNKIEWRVYFFLSFIFEV